MNTIVNKILIVFYSIENKEVTVYSQHGIDLYPEVYVISDLKINNLISN